MHWSPSTSAGSVWRGCSASSSCVCTWMQTSSAPAWRLWKRPSSISLTEEPQEDYPKEGAAANCLLPLLHWECADILHLCVGLELHHSTQESTYKGSLTSREKSLAALFPPWRTSAAHAVSKGHTRSCGTAMQIPDTGPCAIHSAHTVYFILHICYYVYIVIAACLSFSTNAGQ